jgi:hypothetical protein
MQGTVVVRMGSVSAVRALLRVRIRPVLDG